MKSFRQFLNEQDLEGAEWKELSSAEVSEHSKSIINLVQHAYAGTNHGSYINEPKDLVGSKWLVLFYDGEPEAALFYRTARSNENWTGHKIQGIGRNTDTRSKKAVLAKLIELIKTPGFWIESAAAEGSEGITRVMKSRGIPHEEDQEKLKKLFPTITEFLPNGSYKRNVAGKDLQEFVFGDVRLK